VITHAATTLNLAHMLEHHARQSPGRAAISCAGQKTTYRELNAWSNRIANGLIARGIRPGDHIALTCPNIAHFPAIYFGILKAGAVVVPLNVLCKPPEIAYFLRDSDAVAYFCFEGTPELPMARMGHQAFSEVEGCKHFITVTVDPNARGPIEAVDTLSNLTRDQSAEFESLATRPDDTAVILYTSGTTGQPKGAELTQFNMFLNAALSHELFMPAIDPHPDASNVGLITLPLFHSTGQTAQMNAYLFGGMTSILLPRFEPGAVLDTMVRERVNCWIGVPTMYWTLLQFVKANPDRVDVSGIANHLRLACSGGAPMPVEVLKQFEQTFGVRVMEGYGLSETAPVACFNQFQRRSKPGTVGQPLMAVQVACVDDQDRPVKTGERGEVVIRGHNIMKGYYKRPSDTAEAMRNGWFHTGDIGIFDEDGYLAIVDRKKDMILRGGFNVYPREIEEVLMTHPAVSLCAVIGVPDERLGEEVKAIVVCKPGAAGDADEIIAWCKEQMAAYKYPRSIEFRDALPVSATGKILKRELRAQEQPAR
jgi:long-chain acyl-CoA synthetase